MKRHASPVPGWAGVWDGVERPAPELSDELFARHRVEVPVGGERDRPASAFSVAAYTTREEIDRLSAAFARKLHAEHPEQDE